MQEWVVDEKDRVAILECSTQVFKKACLRQRAIAEMRRGWVHATWLKPALMRYCGSCVDLPHPEKPPLQSLCNPLLLQQIVGTLEGQVLVHAVGVLNLACQKHFGDMVFYSPMVVVGEPLRYFLVPPSPAKNPVAHNGL